MGSKIFSLSFKNQTHPTCGGTHTLIFSSCVKYFLSPKKENNINKFKSNPDDNTLKMLLNGLNKIAKL
jgi:hypothetical protein